MFGFVFITRLLLLFFNNVDRMIDFFSKSGDFGLKNLKLLITLLQLHLHTSNFAPELVLALLTANKLV